MPKTEKPTKKRRAFDEIIERSRNDRFFKRKESGSGETIEGKKGGKKQESFLSFFLFLHECRKKKMH